jgi:hypothetical protein
LSFLFPAVLLALAPAAHAGTCPEPVALAQLTDTLDRAEAAWSGADEPAFLLRMEEAFLELNCVDAVVAPPLSARIHRDTGLWLYASGDKDGAGRAFASARRVESGHVLPPGFAPPTHPVRTLFDASSPDPATTAAPTPLAGTLLFDGTPGDRPSAGPAIAQLQAADGALDWTRYLRVDHDLPPYAAVVAASPPPDDPVAPPAPPPRERNPAGPAVRWGLVGGAGAFAVGSGVFALVARTTQDTMQTEPPATKAEIEALYDRNHRASTASAHACSANG